MSASNGSKVPVVFGAMTFGNGKEQSRVSSLDDCKAILDSYVAHAPEPEIDTARVYGGGSSEEYLAKLLPQYSSVNGGKGIILATKLYPTGATAILGNMFKGFDVITHGPEDLRKHLLKSLDAMKVKKLDIWYLHGPDRTTDYEVTMKGVNDLHKEGYFDRFGVSNFAAWEVARICEICKANGYIMPSVYQGIYNALTRTVESELFRCLRFYGMSMYAFNPLAGGLLAGAITRDSEIEKGSRFDSSRAQGKLIRDRFWKDEYFDGVEQIRAVCEKKGLTMAEVALRWMNHHSEMSAEKGDRILIGASSLKHIEQNMKDFEKGPLDEEVVKVIDEAWGRIKGARFDYFH